MISDKRLKELAEEMAGHMGLDRARHGRPVAVKPGNVVPFQRAGMDPQTRDVIYRRIRDLARLYSLPWLVRQETEHVSGVLECLTDADLRDLRDRMELARECCVDGVPFEEHGLIRRRDA